MFEGNTLRALLLTTEVENARIRSSSLRGICDGNMKSMRNYTCVLAMVLLFLVQSTGCARNDNVRQYEAVCAIYLDNLPQEFALLPDGLRDCVEITVSIRNVSTDKVFRAKLSDKNSFYQEMELLPGTYDITMVYVSNSGLISLNVESGSASIDVVAHRQTYLPVHISNQAEFREVLRNSQPKEEILTLDIYSRKVQYGEQIMDLNDIQTLMTFPESQHILHPAEVGYIASTSHSGISLIMQNQTRSSVSTSDATFTGVRFYNVNAVLPGGIGVGMSIPAIAHAEEGVLGTPGYCLGTPLMGIGHDATTFVYLDRISGDRVSFYFNPEDLFVRAITYEFAKYE